MDGNCVASSVKLLYLGILYRFMGAEKIFVWFFLSLHRWKKILANKIVSLYSIFFSKIVYLYRFNRYIFEYRCPPLVIYMTKDLLIYCENICAFFHKLGSPSLYMTLHSIPSEFPYIWGKFCFLFISAFACLPLGQLLLLLWFLVSFGWFSAMALCSLLLWLQP